MQDFKQGQEQLQEKSQETAALQQKDWRLEEQHLRECIELIQHNIESYEHKYRELSDETKELYDNYRSSNPELHNDLVIGLDMKSMMQRVLQQNLRAIKKPYFGRIDYKEAGDAQDFVLYLGKNGVRKNITENMIIDWRSPVASIYYESDIGESSYQTPQGELINILLNRKRTYEISDSKLIDFYDSDVVANDEFLTKYLGKNKEVVLGEIIATIQKEQNEIIRDTPWHSVIVQGVAGSGKTTVAMHRISYILYNYKDKFRPDEFYIIGSNKMLLNYITGVLPNLDVYNVNQMTMEEFLLALLDKDLDLKKGKYTLVSSFMKLDFEEQKEDAVEVKRFKGSLNYSRALVEYLKQYEQNYVNCDTVAYQGEVIFSEGDISYFINFFEYLPLQEKLELLNKRLVKKINDINEEAELRKEERKAEANKYKNYFGSRNKKYNLYEIYLGFIKDLMTGKEKKYESHGISVPSERVLRLMLSELENKQIDIYDLAMLTYIKKKIRLTKDFEYVSHIIIDEAQDFGVMLYDILHRLFKECTYTIMGDVSQNIYYDTGMNDWEALKQEVFVPDKDRFYVLAKSYRNTVEISDYASSVLKKCSFKTYDIEPIIRHGKAVSVTRTDNELQMVQAVVIFLKQIQSSGYDTIAVICRTAKETARVKKLLKQHIVIENPEGDAAQEMNFQNGVMVLPIYMSKGLEFDAVILWNPDEDSYQTKDGDAKLLYVAITRALHELYILYRGRLSGLLQ